MARRFDAVVGPSSGRQVPRVVSNSNKSVPFLQAQPAIAQRISSDPISLVIRCRRCLPSSVIEIVEVAWCSRCTRPPNAMRDLPHADIDFGQIRNAALLSTNARTFFSTNAHIGDAAIHRLFNLATQQDPTCPG